MHTIPRKIIVDILKKLVPSRLTNKHTMYDAGYEQCKKDILVTIQRSLDLKTSTDPITNMIEEIHHG